MGLDGTPMSRPSAGQVQEQIKPLASAGRVQVAGGHALYALKSEGLLHFTRWVLVFHYFLYQVHLQVQLR